MVDFGGLNSKFRKYIFRRIKPAGSYLPQRVKNEARMGSISATPLSKCMYSKVFIIPVSLKIIVLCKVQKGYVI